MMDKTEGEILASIKERLGGYDIEIYGAAALLASLPYVVAYQEDDEGYWTATCPQLGEGFLATGKTLAECENDVRTLKIDWIASLIEYEQPIPLPLPPPPKESA